ncbi:carboxylesterase [Pyrenochaeta sp. DS3sAY3a]|nr:carboxylesterase [Pyrenochaeta sp. DS3sAY3a]
MARKYADSWLALEESIGRKPMGGTVEELRQQYAALITYLKEHSTPRQYAVDSHDGNVDGVKYRLYTSKNRETSKSLPVLIWTHGGGLVVGDLDFDDEYCRAVTEELDVIVVSVDYRLAPEHKIPTQLQDTLSVFTWARANATSFGGDPEKFITIGGSAGGGLALQVANELAKHPETRHHIKGVAAFVPVTLHYANVPEEYKTMYTSYEENAKDVPMIDKNSMDLFFSYSAADARDPGAFAALATDTHEFFPPTYLMTCEFDPLRDDGVVMEYALKKAGVTVKRDHFDGFPHYFWVYPTIPERTIFTAKLIEGLRWLLSL